MQYDEKEWIKESLKGERAAFDKLVERYQGRIFKRCFEKVRDQEIAEDLTQETFLHAYRGLNRFRMDSSFYTWIYRIATNLSLNYLKQKREVQPLYEEHVASRETVHDPELEALIQEGLATLSPKQREVFEMFEFQRLPHKEIAAKLGIQPGTVRSRLFYARKNLRQFLESHSTSPISFWKES